MIFARQFLLIFALLAVRAPIAAADGPAAPAGHELRRFDAPEATQAVAVDATSFYAIDNSVIAKYSKTTGKRSKVWRASAELPLAHLNSGVVLDGRLYCAN